MAGLKLSAAPGESRAKFLSAVRRDLRRRDRESLKRLKEDIAEARAKRRATMRKVVKRCQQKRMALRERIKKLRKVERERVNRIVESMKLEARSQCSARKARAREAGLKGEAKAKEQHSARKQLNRDIRAAEAHREKRERKFRANPAELQRESDDRVRANIDAAMVPVFNRVRRTIKGNQRRSRTEAFLEWAEENPAEVLAIQQEATDRELKRLLREQQRAQKQAKVRKTRGYKPSKAELAEYLKDVPF